MFDAFSGSDVSTLSEAGEVIEGFFLRIIKSERKIGFYCIIISVILLGISFILKNTAQDVSVNKSWAVRIILASSLIFGLGGFLSLIIGASI